MGLSGLSDSGFVLVFMKPETRIVDEWSRKKRLTETREGSMGLRRI